MANNVRKELEELKNEILNGMPRIVARTAKDYFQTLSKKKRSMASHGRDFRPTTSIVLTAR